MEEEEEEEKKMKEEKKSEKSTMELLFDYVKEEEKKGDQSKFRFVVKKRNLENNPPKRNEKLRAGLEKKTLINLLLAIKGKLEKLVVNHEDTHTVTFFYDEKEESFKLSLPGFMEEFLEKVKAYGNDRGRMSPLLPEQSECFLKILIECQRFEDVECAIDGIDDSFGSANTMNRLLSLMEELVEEQRYNPDPIVKFDRQSTIELIKAFEFMKVFKDTRDSNARKYCCILMFLILTTDIYIENMRRAKWVESLKRRKCTSKK